MVKAMTPSSNFTFKRHIPRLLGGLISLNIDKERPLLVPLERNELSMALIYAALYYEVPLIPISSHSSSLEKAAIYHHVGNVQSTTIDHLLAQNHSYTKDTIEFPDDKIAFIIQTSGSCGIPKFVAHRFGPYFSRYKNKPFLATRHPSEGKTALVLPLYHIGGLTAFHCAVAAQSPITPFPDKNSIFALQDYHFVSATPAHLALFKEKNYKPKQLKMLLGAAPIEPELFQWALQEGLDLSFAYGMSELTTIAVGKSPDQLTPLCDLSLCLIDGKIAIDSPHLFAGYYKNGILHSPESPFITADRGALDKNYLKVLGRSDRMINKAGFKIDPAEIESLASLFPDVKKAFLTEHSLTIETGDQFDLILFKKYLMENLHPKKVPDKLVKLVR